MEPVMRILFLKYLSEALHLFLHFVSILIMVLQFPHEKKQ
jgi:hypothetical protein